VGAQGRVDVQVLSGAPVTRIQVQLGTQVVGEITGAELRFVRAIGFAVPRVRGDYVLFIAAHDGRGCDARTTQSRPLTVF
jgi:hypothetical protein